MNVGQYLLELSLYVVGVALVLMAATRFRGGRGLLAGVATVIAISTGFYFTMRHRAGTVTPLASSIVAAVATAALAAVIWRRRSRSSGLGRVFTILWGLLAFHVAWLGAGLALRNWR
jgi:hypothetical protein